MIDHLSDIKKIDRFGEIPHEGSVALHIFLTLQDQCAIYYGVIQNLKWKVDGV